MYIQSNGFVLHPGANHKIGAIPKPINELDHTPLSELSPLPGIGHALQKLFRVLSRDRRSFNRVMLSFHHDDRRTADMQPQLIRSIGMNQMKKIIHRIHTLQSGQRKADR